MLNGHSNVQSKDLRYAIKNAQSYGVPRVVANIEKGKTSNIIFVIQTVYFGCVIIKFDNSTKEVKSLKDLESGNVFGYIGNHLYICE